MSSSWIVLYPHCKHISAQIRIFPNSLPFTLCSLWHSTKMTDNKWSLIDFLVFFINLLCHNDIGNSVPLFFDWPLLSSAICVYSSLHHWVLENIWPFGSIHTLLLFLAPTFVKRTFLEVSRKCFSALLCKQTGKNLHPSAFTCRWPLSVWTFNTP